MPQTPEDWLQAIRAQRSSEGNFDTVCKMLQEAIASAKENDNEALATDLQEVADKQEAQYRKAKETGGSAWPEYENFISEFERALANGKKAGQ